MGNILFGLIPALMWGIQPLVMTKLGGKSSNKVMGMALGILLGGLIGSLYRGEGSLSPRIIIISFIDGLALSYGLINQIRGLEILGVSKGTPISTGTQLVGASLVGAIYFKEWSTGYQYLLGSLGIVLIIGGVAMTAFEEGESSGGDLRSGVVTLLLSSLGFVLYTVILRLGNISIWQALIPQGIGMVVGSYSLVRSGYKGKIFVKNTLSHVLTGLIFAIGNITLMVSNGLNGLALGFTLTQMNVVIATIGGLLFLKEPKTRKELYLTILGLVLVVLGGFLIGRTKL